MARILIIVVSIMAFVVAATLKQMGFHFLGAAPPPVSEWVVGTKAVSIALLYYSLTILGIAAGVTFEALEKEKSEIVNWDTIKGYLRTPTSWRGLVASPLIFLSVYMGVRSSPISVPFILLAFQNGFFWKSALRDWRPVPVQHQHQHQHQQTRGSEKAHSNMGSSTARPRSYQLSHACDT
jgi:hypothetical protein